MMAKDRRDKVRAALGRSSTTPSNVVSAQVAQAKLVDFSERMRTMRCASFRNTRRIRFSGKCRQHFCYG